MSQITELKLEADQAAFFEGYLSDETLADTIEFMEEVLHGVANYSVFIQQVSVMPNAMENFVGFLRRLKQLRNTRHVKRFGEDYLVSSMHYYPELDGMALRPIRPDQSRSKGVKIEIDMDTIGMDVTC